MKTDLSYLPEDKQREVRRVAETIRNAVDPEMIILFGSHARGDWVEDRYEKDGVIYEYQSDYDILVIVRPRHEEGGSNRLYPRIERRIREILPPGSPVNAIAHNFDHVNTKLAEGQYFFADVVKEGVLLYDSGRHKLAEPKALSDAERKEIAERDLGHWLRSADDFFFNFERSSETGRLSNAAFQLHQAAERYYTTMLLVHIGYKPKTHDLEKLRKLATTQVPELIRVFPCAADEEKARSELLNKAYVDARYDPDYSISREDLEYLGERVRELRSLTESACRRKIASLSA
ncbi:MAG: HEPN domain-containing protein [Planctomycetota bacterium]|jgi:HEPN domain-containing protein